MAMLLLLYTLLSSLIIFASAEQLPLPKGLLGPVSIIFDSNGDGPYTGISDGRVLKYQVSSKTFKNYAIGSLKWSRKNCDGLKQPVTCGRPLGMSFNNRNKKLYYTDAFYGLQVVKCRGGFAGQLATAANNLPFYLLTDVVVQVSTGNLYCTDYSQKYNLQNISVSASDTNDATGRLIKFDPETRKTTVVMEKLFGASGVAISKDGTFLLVSELSAKRIQRYWLEGPKANTAEVFKTLEGSPAEIKVTADGNFWVAVNRVNLEDKSPIPTGVKLDGEGNVLQELNLTGIISKNVVTAIEENNGKLYMGSFDIKFIGVYTL